MERLYDAAVAPGLWSDAITHLAAALRGAAVLLHLRFPHADDPGCAVACGIGPTYVARYSAEFAANDPFLEPACDIATGAVVAMGDVLGAKDLSTNPFYEHWMQPQRLLPTGGFVSVITRHREQPHTTLHVFEKWGGSRLDKRAVDLLRALLPHLRRAAVISDALQQESARRQALEHLLNRGPLAVFLVDPRRQVLSANEQAKYLLSLGDGIEVGNDGLQGVGPDGAAALAAAIEAVRRGSGDQVLRLSRQGERRALMVVVTQPPGIAADAEVPATPVALIVADPEQRGAVPIAHLQSLFGFTPAEARAAWLIGHGLRIDEVAGRLGVRIETVRAHLKQIFDKAGVSRQAELVRLLLSSPIVLAQPWARG